jgi:hypothetical protein
MRGILTIEVRRNGVLLALITDENLIVNGAKNQLARLIGGDGTNRQITHFGVGIGTSPAHPDNVTLQGGVWKPVSSVSYPDTGKTQFNWNLTTADANGLALTEFGLRCADGTLFSRKQRAAVHKANDIALSGTWTILF